MLIVLYGPDSYRRVQKLGEIVEGHRGLLYERFDLAQADAVLELRDFVDTPSIFPGERLAVLDNILDAPSQRDVKELLKSCRGRKDITVVANLERKPPANYAFLLEFADEQYAYPLLKKEEFAAFVRNVAESCGVSLDEETARLLVEVYEGDSWAVVTELTQLSFSKEEKLRISSAPSYFGLVHALKRGRGLRGRVVALEYLLSSRGDDPARIFNSIAYSLGNSSEAERLANYDILVKSGKLEYEEALLALALGL